MRANDQVKRDVGVAGREKLELDYYVASAHDVSYSRLSSLVDSRVHSSCVLRKKKSCLQFV